ncbi:hypothetical protein E3T61_20235, partial [Cryobacterium lactosi]
MSRPPQILPIEEVARVAERLAVLLAAGVSPVSVWDYLLPAGPSAAPERASPTADAWPPRTEPAAGAEPSHRATPVEAARSRLSRRARAQAETERAQHSILAAAGRA